MTRRTYTERRVYAARVMRFRKAVYAARRDLTSGCQLLLLRLSDDMNERCVVSVPRSVLSEDLDAPKPRITEWVAEAVKAGFLSPVVRGRPGVSAVYQGIYRGPSEVRPSVPSTRYGKPDHAEVRPGVPSTAPTRYATGGTHEEERTAPSAHTVTEATHHPSERRTKEEQVPGRASARLPRYWHDLEPPDLEEPEPRAVREESA